MYSQNPSPRDRCIQQQLALQHQHRMERVSRLLSLIGMATSCMDYQVHVNRSIGSCQQVCNVPRRIFMAENDEREEGAQLAAELAGYHLKKDILYS